MHTKIFNQDSDQLVNESIDIECLPKFQSELDINLLLEINTLIKSAKNAEVSEDVRAIIEESVCLIISDDALTKLFLYYYDLLFVDKDPGIVTDVIEPCEQMKEKSGMFKALLALSYVPTYMKLGREKGISEEILTHTMTDISIWIDEYKKETGKLGLGNLKWLMHHLNHELYRIGR